MISKPKSSRTAGAFLLYGQVYYCGRCTSANKSHALEEETMIMKLVLLIGTAILAGEHYYALTHIHYVHKALGQ